jgi:hypothetical protein
MFKRLKAAWVCLCRPEAAARVFVEDATLTPAECRVCFEFIRNLFTAWTLKDSPEFLSRVQAADVELYWRLIYFSIEVEQIDRPVRAEWFHWYLTEYAQVMNNAFIVDRNVSPGA